MALSFLNPGLFLAGAACIAVPILIHFFMRRRRTPIRWGAMRFLLEAYRQQRRRIRFEQVLLLALRCLLLALIAGAVGKPALDARGAHARTGPTTLYLLIDNSLTASAQSPDGARALDRHLDGARSLVARLDPARGDRVAVLALAAPPESIVLPPSPDLASVRGVLDRIGPSESAADLPGAAAIVRDQIASVPDDQGVTVAVLSDFRAGSADPQRPLAALVSGAGPRPRILAGRPASEGLTNLTVLGAEPLTPVLLRTGAASSPVRVTVRRDGEGVGAAQTSAVRVRLSRPGAESPPFAASIRWTPGQTQASIPVQAEMPRAEAGAIDELVVRASVDQDAIAGDNDLFRRVVVRESITAAIVAPRDPAASGAARYGPAEWVTLALEPTSQSRWAADAPASEVKTRRIDPGLLDGAALAGADAAFVLAPDLVPAPGWERLRRFVDAGGLVVVFPALAAEPHQWTPAFVEAFALPWTIAPDTRPFDTPAPLLLDAATVNASPLARLAAELPDLVRPVTVRRAVAIGPPDALDRSLSIEPGLPLLALDAPASRVGDGAPRASRGLVALLAVAPDLSWSDLPAMPLMVPLMQELLRQGVGRSAGAAHAVAGAVPALPPGASTLRAIDGPAAGAEMPTFAGGVALTRAGVYRVADERGVSQGLVTVDADPGAGLVEPRTDQEIAPWLAGLGSPPEWMGGDTAAPSSSSAAAGDPRRGRAWSLWLFLAAAAVALLELALARLFSHAPAARRAGVPTTPAGVAA
ncbi:MAG: hypothetical protein FJ255_00215 [Phycisphaerae bacterium]|nr:hypothetical protein [Phycisphaerae bacterium]